MFHLSWTDGSIQVHLIWMVSAHAILIQIKGAMTREIAERMEIGRV